MFQGFEADLTDTEPINWTGMERRTKYLVLDYISLSYLRFSVATNPFDVRGTISMDPSSTVLELFLMFQLIGTVRSMAGDNSLLSLHPSSLPISHGFILSTEIYRTNEPSLAMSYLVAISLLSEHSELDLKDLKRARPIASPLQSLRPSLAGYCIQFLAPSQAALSSLRPGSANGHPWLG